MKNEVKTSNSDVQFTVKTFNDESLPPRFKHLMKHCDKPNNSQLSLSSPNKRMRRVLNANGISLNEFGAYQLNVAVPLTFKLKGLSRPCYHTALKTDIPELAIERAKQVKAEIKPFFKEQGVIIDELMTMQKVTFLHRILAVLYKMRCQFEPQFVNLKEDEFDFPEWGNLDLSNVEDYEAFPYQERWENVMLDKLNAGYSPLRFIEASASLYPFFQFAKNELQSTGQTSFPTITAELIHHYFKTLKQNSVKKKQREQHRYAIHFFFRLLNQQGYSHVNTRKVLSTSLSMFK
ncbi:hypothetical protein [Vibrio splendidus]|uniref:hypothetical protein n=1 Tax=Vibrio splendidus TaxID=29497 RepID=UPI000C83F6D4|nr:hypothetical protein [Vibrio splendidus]PMI54258.1 hypothetical protein BCU42_18620 [Vibrio splendidus]